MGDVLMTTPALRALAQAGPNRRLTLLTSPSGSAAANLIPYVDDVILYEAPWMKASAARASSHYDRRMADRLRSGGFDAAVIFTCYTQSPLPAAWLCRLGDIPLRLACCRENPYQLLTDWVKEDEPEVRVRHEVRRQLDLVAAIGSTTLDERMSVAVGAAAAERIDSLLTNCVDVSRRWIVLHPGATAASRRYPAEQFAEVARLVRQSLDCQIVWTGAPDEVSLVAGLQDLMEAPSCSLAGQLTVEELAALIARAPLLVSNNTAAVHLASALSTPVVDLYALTNPQHTPWMVPCRVLYQDVPCRFCYKSQCPEGHHRCLRDLSPETVVAAVFDLLDESSSSARSASFIALVSPVRPATRRTDRPAQGQLVSGRPLVHLLRSFNDLSINRKESPMHHEHHEMTTQMRQCLEACTACAEICDRCADDMIGMDAHGDKELQRLCIRLCQDCADICALSTRWMSRLSPSAEQLCRTCAELCDRCAEVCERHAPHHPLCGDCAAECRRCAAACREMAGAAA